MATINKMIILTITLIHLQSTIATPLYNNPNNTTTTTNKTIADLVQQQANQVKKIVADHRNGQLDYPIIKPQQQTTTTDFEQLKIKCQHISKLIHYNNNQTKPTTNGFYVTTTATTTTTTTTEKPPNTNNIKYIKLEPVILQKTILNDGRTIYYWHKSLPSAVKITTTTTPATTTTTTMAPPSYDFRNFFPSFYSSGTIESSTTTTTEKTPTTTTLINNNNEDDLLSIYQQQLRFIIPVPYVNQHDQPPMKKPWEFDQYAYYPKQLQPEHVNLQVPYVPTFHVIKALAVPNQNGGD